MPVGLLERPCCAFSSTSLPWESSHRLGAPRMGLGRRLLLATGTSRQPAPPQSPLLPPPPPKPCIGGTRPRVRWVSCCGLPVPALPSWTTLLGCFVGTAGVQTCAPAWRQSKVWVFILHWWGRRWPRLCRTSVFLHPITALQRSCSGANAVGTIPRLDGAACSLSPSPCLAGGCFGFTAWQVSALMPPDLPPGLLCTAQIVQRIRADILWVPHPHQCRDTGGQSETPVRLVHHLRELCLLTRHTAQC